LRLFFGKCDVVFSNGYDKEMYGLLV
jgi:hypothetical protein